MHATMERKAATEHKALFFASAPEARDTAAIGRPAEHSAYGRRRGPSWSALLAIVAIHVAALQALVTLDVIEIAPPKKALVVFDLVEPPVPPVEKPRTEVVEKIEPIAEAPQPVVQPLAPPPPPIAVTSAPPSPTPAVVAAPPPSGPATVGNLDERRIEGRPPRYPLESRRRKEQGTVLLRLLIGTDGRVAQISIAQSSGFERLDQAALQAARSWRWQPMIRDGHPVEVRGVMPIPFVLQG